MPDINLLKRVVEGFGALNEGQKALMELFDVQSKNIFEILLYPQNLSLSIGSVAGAALDTLMARFHIQSMTIPFVGIEYEKANEHKYVKDVIPPEECTLTFIENELGAVRNYMNSWVKSIMIPDLKGGYFFNSDQLAPKKNALIIPQMSIGLPSTGWIEIQGLNYKSTADLEMGHSVADPMTLDVTFAVDNVWWKTLF